MASLLERTRLAVHKQSFLNLLRQKGCSMTKVYYNKDVYLKDVSHVPWFILDTFDYVEDKLHVYYYNTPFTQILDQHVPLKTAKL